MGVEQKKRYHVDLLQHVLRGEKVVEAIVRVYERLFIGGALAALLWGDTDSATNRHVWTLLGVYIDV